MRTDSPDPVTVIRSSKRTKLTGPVLTAVRGMKRLVTGAPSQLSRRRRGVDQEREPLGRDARLELRLDPRQQLRHFALRHALGEAPAQLVERRLGLVEALRGQGQPVAQIEVALLEAEQIGFELVGARLISPTRRPGRSRRRRR